MQSTRTVGFLWTVESIAPAANVMHVAHGTDRQHAMFVDLSDPQ